MPSLCQSILEMEIENRQISLTSWNLSSIKRREIIEKINAEDVQYYTVLITTGKTEERKNRKNWINRETLPF